MGRMDEDSVTRATIDPDIAAACLDEDEAVGMDGRDNMPTKPVVDVDEWLAEEAGYGYGV